MFQFNPFIFSNIIFIKAYKTNFAYLTRFYKCSRYLFSSYYGVSFPFSVTTLQRHCSSAPASIPLVFSGSML